LFAFEPEAEGEPAGMVSLHAGRRVDRHFEDLLRILGGNLLDLHPAFGGGHHRHARARSVDQHAEIEFAGDVAALLDVDAGDLPAFRPGLLGHKAQHLRGAAADLCDRLGDADATLTPRVVLEMPGAAAASMDLRFDDPDCSAK
jgi:hypothetical protein